ncbi:hypothetical protein B0J14DRAFT_648049 [Halenospora varia]|nr:hypothetical protein B0J14DRAFT_648049 [Halenospora varia]
MSTEGRYSCPDPEMLYPTPTVTNTKARKMRADQEHEEAESLALRTVVCSQHENNDLECPDCHRNPANAPQATQDRRINDSKLQHLATIATLPGPQIFQKQVVFPEATLMRAHLSTCAKTGTPYNLRTTFEPISSDESVDTEAIAFDHAKLLPDLTVQNVYGRPPVLGPVDTHTYSRSPQKESRDLRRATLKRNAEARMERGWQWVYMLPPEDA